MEIITIRKATFIDRCKREQESEGPNGGLISADRTRFSSQGGADLDVRKNVLKILFRDFTVGGWANNEQLSTRGWKALIAVK